MENTNKTVLPVDFGNLIPRATSPSSEKPIKVVAKKPEEKVPQPSDVSQKSEEVKKTTRHFVESPTSEISVVPFVKKETESPQVKRRGRSYPVVESDDSDSDSEKKTNRWPEFSEYLTKKEPESPEDYLRVFLRMMGVADDRLTTSALVHILVLFYDTEARIAECYRKGKKLQSSTVQELL